MLNIFLILFNLFWFKGIEMKVDSCSLPSCLSISPPIGPNEYLNVNGPLQLGGSFVDLSLVAAARNWTHKPFGSGFNGCIRNLTFNGRLYNLGAPSLSYNIDFACTHGTAVAVSFGIDASFLIAIFVCLAVLLSKSCHILLISADIMQQIFFFNLFV